VGSVRESASYTVIEVMHLNMQFVKIIHIPFESRRVGIARDDRRRRHGNGHRYGLMRRHKLAGLFSTRVQVRVSTV